MNFVSTNWTWQNKDWLDQPAHAAAGVAFAMFFFLFTPAPLAAAASMVVGFGREWRQHKPVFIDVDSVFWASGAAYWAMFF